MQHGRLIVENALGILKQCFYEFIQISNLRVSFVLDVVICCCLLYNLLLDQSTKEVKTLFDILRRKGMVHEVNNNQTKLKDAIGLPAIIFNYREKKQQALGRYLIKKCYIDVDD